MTAPSPSAAAALLPALKFDRDGLVAAVAQQHDTGEVLMLAWMNRDAVDGDAGDRRASATGRARARSSGARARRSGQAQRLVELRVDCDGDTLLLLRRSDRRRLPHRDGAAASSAPCATAGSRRSPSRWSIAGRLYGAEA